MKINVEELRNEKKEIYSHLWKNKEFNVIKKGNSDPSYEFEFGKTDLVTYVGTSLANNFGIQKDNKEQFLAKFEMACSGSGDELQKITTMHSSSLCSLLFFFSVRDDNPLKITLNSKEYEFTKSYFEFKNKVIKSPSNMDVVLLGKNTVTKKNVILFLESKFSEFITGVTSKLEIGKSYFKPGCFSEPIYNQLNEKNILKKEGATLVSPDIDNEKYIEGIKQMISHYYGIRNFIEGKYYKEEDACQKEVINFSKETNCEILLGTILFDNFSKTQKEKYLEPYKKDYTELAKIINDQFVKEINENDVNFKMLEEPLTYSSIKNFIFDLPKIRQYYFGE